MNLVETLHSHLFTCILVGVSMVIVAALPFLRNRRVIKERTGIIIIVTVLFLALLALTQNIE